MAKISYESYDSKVLKERALNSKFSSDKACICPTCKKRFSPDEIKGEYLARKCPVCLSLICVEQFDEIAKVIIEERKKPREKLESLSAVMRSVNRAIGITKPQEVYALSGLRERKEFLSSEIEKLMRSMDELNSQLEIIAKSRYYVSEWYLRTNIDLDYHDTTMSISIKPHYSSNGIWCFKCNDSGEAGFAAELYVSQLLFQCANDPKSPLYKAQIFPNIYIPRKRDDQRTSFWMQIDCLMITQYAVFILEIKRHSKYIYVPDDSAYTSIYSSRNLNKTIESISDLLKMGDRELNSLGLSVKETGSIVQNELHAECFMSLCPMFDLSDVYRQIIYVKPKRFTSNISGFVNGISVDYAFYHDPHFLETIEALCASLPRKYSQQQIDDIANMIITPNCDFNHRRESIHKMISKQCKKPNGKSKRKR